MSELMNNSEILCEFSPLIFIVPQKRRSPLLLSELEELSLCNIIIIINVIPSDYCDYKWLFLQVIIKFLNYLVFKHQDTTHAFQNLTHCIFMSVSLGSWSVNYLLPEGELDYLCGLVQIQHTHFSKQFFSDCRHLFHSAKTFLRAELGIFLRRGNPDE